MIAGPSEVVVLADSSADPRYVAADLLAQAEHDEAAQSILITDDARSRARSARGCRAPARRACRAQKIAGASWRDYRRDHSGARASPRRSPLVDRLAPEHLEIIARDADALSRSDQQRRRDLPRRLHARGDRRLRRRLQSCAADLALGALLLRPRRLDFVKRTSILRCDAQALARARAGGDHARRGRRASRPTRARSRSARRSRRSDA